MKCAMRATCAARHKWFVALRLRWALWHVSALFIFLRVSNAFLCCIDAIRPSIKRVSPQ